MPNVIYYNHNIKPPLEQPAYLEGLETLMSSVVGVVS